MLHCRGYKLVRPGFSGLLNNLKIFRALPVLSVGEIGTLEREFLCRVSKCKQAIYPLLVLSLCGFCLQ